MKMNLTPTFEKTRQASRTIANLSETERNNVLISLADMIIARQSQLLQANATDLARMSPDSPLYDRLRLTPDRLSAIASDIRKVASLQSPIGEEIERRILPNGLLLRRVRVPFGVIGVIYEARPNVTFDVFALCFKSGNACILKGGSDADCSNRAAMSLIHEALEAHGIDPYVATLLPSTHEATAEMLNATGYIDICIPRGGRRLIDFVRDNARIPVIETGAGVVHTFIDKDADINMAITIVDNAKTRRVSVCNALDTLLIHRDRLTDLPSICELLATKGVELHADSEAYTALSGHYPIELLTEATPDDWDREWMDYKMSIATVGSISDAIEHIGRHGSGHSESIVTDNTATATEFQDRVDASCVYVNAPTSFTDGAQFDLGAEIGISTQKLGPRGPMGLKELTTYRYLINGNGQIRPA